MARFTSRTFASRSLRTTFAVALLALAVGCTSSKNDSSSISITLPDFNQTLPKAKAQSQNQSQKIAAQGSVAAYETLRIPTRVMINVTGPGMQPIVKIIERRELMAHLISEKDLSFRLDVPRGSGRLIQLLAITSDIERDNSGNELDESGETFFYGDAVRDITSRTEEAVDLSVKQVDVGTGGADGVIAGRILDDANSGPTGKLAVKFTPPSRTNAPMVVSQTEIHGGWFEVFALEGAGFSYSLENGSDIFTNVQLKASQPPVYRGAVQSFDQSRVFVSVPSAFKNLYLPQAQTPFARREAKPKKFIFGFFGPGASGKKVCYNNATTPTIDDLYVSSDITNLTKVGWAGTGLPTLALAGVDTGGSAATGGLCGDGTYWNDRLAIDVSRLDNGHGTLNFRGAFRIFPITSATDQGIIDVKWNASNAKYDLKYQFLPGATGEKRVNGVGVFTRVLTSVETNQDRAPYEEDDGIACNKLTDSSYLAQPFSLHSRIPVQGDGSAIQTASLGGFVGNELANQRLQVVLCPYSDSREGYFSGAIDFRGGNSGGPTNSVPRAQLKIAAVSGGAFTLIDDVCREVKISVKDSTGAAVNIPAGSDLSVDLGWKSSTTGMTAAFYPSSSCGTGQQIDSTSILIGTSEATVYFKPEAPGLVQLRAEPSSVLTGLQVEFDEQGFGIVPASAPPIHRVRVDVNFQPRAMVSGQCYPVDYKLEGSTGFPTLASNGAVTATFTGVSGQYFTTRNCTGTTASVMTIPLGNHASRYFFKPAATATPATGLELSVSGAADHSTGTPTAIATVVSSGDISLSPAGQIAQLGIRFAGTWETYKADYSCQSARVVALSTYGAEVNLTSAQSGTVAINSGGKIYPSNSNCASGGVNTSRDFQIQSGEAFSEWFLVKNEAANSMIFALTGPSTNTYLVPAAAPGNVNLELVDATNYVKNFCHPVKFRAKKDTNDFALPAAYSITNVALNNGALYSNSSCSTTSSTIQFAAGTAESSTMYLQPTFSSAPSFTSNNGTNFGSPSVQINAPTSAPQYYGTATYTAGSYTGNCYNFDVHIPGLSSAPVLMIFDLLASAGDILHEGYGCSSMSTSNKHSYQILRSGSSAAGKQMSVQRNGVSGVVYINVEPGPNRFVTGSSPTGAFTYPAP